MKPLIPLAFALLIASMPAHAADPTFPPPPRLATTPAELAAEKKAPDFETKKSKALAAADKLLESPVELPNGPAGWIFDYACPDDGSSLQRLSLEEHQCPKCKKIYRDEKTQEAYRANLHYGVEKASLALGWAYAYSGDDKYVSGVQRILLKLADDYPNYPQRHDRWGLVGQLAKLGGRRYVQSLDEGVGIISLAKAYDLTRNSPAWTAAQKSHVEKDLFGLTAQTLLEANQDINNHQTWYNAGLMAIADVLGDKDLVKKVLEMKGGVYDQLQRSVTSDGLWYEGAQAYHTYALQAMIHIADATARLGVPISGNPRFKSLFTGPLKATYPNGDFPVINDSDPISIHSMDGPFLWAWNTYKEPVFAQAYAEGKPGKLAELLGPKAKPETALSTKSENLSEAGLVFLRAGSGDKATTAVLDYGQHGGGHGHFDKLNLMLYANGREWLLDPGRLTYSHKEYKTWVKETIAHNTVTLDGQSQKPVTGKLTDFVANPTYSYCLANTEEAYPGSKLQRYLRLDQNTLLDVYEVTVPAGTLVDWTAHAVVAAIQPTSGAEAADGKPFQPGTRNGYQHLRGGKAWTPKKGSSWDMLEQTDKPDARKLRLWFPAAPGETIITATGIGYRVNQEAPTIIRRRISDGKPMKFVTIYDLSGDGSYVKSAEWKDVISLPSNAKVSELWRGVLINGDTKLTVEAPPIFDIKGDDVGKKIRYNRTSASVGF